MATNEQWVIWNGSMGILDMASIGRVELGAGGRSGFLAPPYGVVGPFSLDDLEREGCIAFGECLVMSRQRWQEDQARLRRDAQAKRRTLRMRPHADDMAHRAVLNLPAEGVLKPVEINAAFRRLAKTAHPAAGGGSEQYRRITDARDALLKRVWERFMMPGRIRRRPNCAAIAGVKLELRAAAGVA